jgi:hypothetical protein
MRFLTVKVLSVVAAILLLVACSTTEFYWQKNGATAQDYNQDKYRCIQESTRSQYSSSPVTNLLTGRYMGQMADAGQYVNEQVFNACMQAAGYSLVTQPAPNYVIRPPEPVPQATQPTPSFTPVCPPSVAAQIDANEVTWCRVVKGEAQQQQPGPALAPTSPDQEMQEALRQDEAHRQQRLKEPGQGWGMQQPAPPKR